jgi:phosphinothricin acetyltransferase
MIRECLETDAAPVCEIYNHYIRETVVTFEETPLTVAEMAQRIAEIGAQFPWLVLEEGGVVIGYAYASTWKTRSAYRFAVESTIYLAPQSTGRGLGRGLYAVLLAEIRRRGFHSVIGGIALPNHASVSLHEKLGFRRIGAFTEVGWKFDRWVDVGYWELILERPA